MRKILFISILLLGCNQFFEENAPLPGNYYIEDGWDAFEQKRYEKAHQLFSASLVGGHNPFYSHAYIGLGWNCFYYANQLTGSENYDKRIEQRDFAYEYFQLALVELEPVDSIQDSELLQNYSDYLSGMTYHWSYNVMKMSELFYLNNNQIYWDEMLMYSDSLISVSDQLLEQTNGEYNFLYDDTFNSDDIRWLRAQTYIRLNQLDEAHAEANNIDFLRDCLEQFTVIQCLNNCQTGTCFSNINP
tara:strand:+ start:115 stop:849 length:735 start_codon:yes stop_codon:yes gene_type:complete